MQTDLTQPVPAQHRYAREIRAVVRWTIPLSAFLVLGPVAALLVRSLRAHDGSHEVTLLNNTSPVMGVLVLGALVVLASLAAIGASRIIGARRGFLTGGLVLAWGAFSCGPVDSIVRTAGSGQPLVMMGVEALLLGVLALGASIAILRVDRDPEFTDAEPLRSQESLIAFALATLGAAGAAWIIARDASAGQALAAGAIAGFAGAGVGHLGAPRARMIVLIGAMLLLGAVAPFAGLLFSPGGSPSNAATAGTLLPLANLSPLDWLAGAWLGLPMGMSNAASHRERHTGKN